MSLARSFRSVFAASLLTVVACSSSDSNDTQASVVSIDSVAPSIADIYCSALQTCMGEVYAYYSNNADCRSQMTKQFAEGLVASWKESTGKGTLVYHDDKVAGCLEALRGQGCSMLDTRAPSVCEEAVEGKVAAGGECTTNSECAGTAYCKPTAACPGVCAAQEGSGASCNSNDACQDGLVCAAGKCLAPIGVGQACRKDESTGKCSSTLMCVGATATKAGTCKTIQEAFSGAEGSTCDIQGGSFCGVGLVCSVQQIQGSSITSVCAKPVGADATCNFSIPNPCPNNQYCNADITKGQLQGKCVAQPQVGEACVNLSGAPECATNLVCEGGVCKEKQLNAGACASDAVCYSGNCTTGSCRPSVNCR